MLGFSLLDCTKSVLTSLTKHLFSVHKTRKCKTINDIAPIGKSNKKGIKVKFHPLYLESRKTTKSRCTGFQPHAAAFVFLKVNNITDMKRRLTDPFPLIR